VKAQLAIGAITQQNPFSMLVAIIALLSMPVSQPTGKYLK
jgi:hypothetical protein